MTTAPSDLPEWATAGTAEISEPPAATKASGWIAAIRPPHEWVNYWWNLVYEWIVYLDVRTRQFGDLGALVLGLDEGDTGELLENDSAYLPGSQISTFTVGANVVDIAVDGRYVYVATASSCTRYTRAGVTTGVTYTPTNAGTVVRVAVNGDVVVLGYGNYVEAFEPAGTSRWVYNHNAAVKDVCVDSTRAYMVGVRDGSNRGLNALTLSTGARSWGYTHDTTITAATLYSVATDGRMVFVAGEATGEASGANIRGINASNGYDAAGEGIPAGVDSDGLSWDAVSTTDMSAGGCLAVDDGRLFAAYQTTLVESRSKLTGAVLASVTPPSGLVARRVSVDQDFVVVGSNVSDDVVVALPKADLSAAWRFHVSGGGVGLATDGAAVWTAPSGTTVYRVARGNRPGRWHRIDPTATLGAVYRWLALPQR